MWICCRWWMGGVFAPGLLKYLKSSSARMVRHSLKWIDENFSLPRYRTRRHAKMMGPGSPVRAPSIDIGIARWWFGAPHSVSVAEVEKMGILKHDTCNPRQRCIGGWFSLLAESLSPVRVVEKWFQFCFPAAIPRNTDWQESVKFHLNPFSRVISSREWKSNVLYWYSSAEGIIIRFNGECLWENTQVYQGNSHTTAPYSSRMLLQASSSSLLNKSAWRSP